MRNSIVTIGVVLGLSTSICLWLLPEVTSTARAQSKSKSTKKGVNVKTLDVRSQRMQSNFLKESLDLARDYESVGELEKAKRVYSALKRLNPKAQEIQDRLKRIDDAILSANAFGIELDTSIGWGVPRARVTKGKPFQVQVTGTYRFQAVLPLGPAGFSTANPAKTDLAENIRCGALMGLIVEANGKPGKPFFIGTKREITPRNSGLLYLRVNSPTGSKCSGRLMVGLGGTVDRD